MFQAWRYIVSVDKIDLEELKDAGIKLILLDRDNTCVPRDSSCAPAEIMTWLDKARSLGFSLCLVSNNFHSEQVERSASELGVDVVHHAMKPAPWAVLRACRLKECAPSEAVLIGDQVFTDVWAAHNAGVKAILVRPQSLTDLWYTKLFRIVENSVLHGVTFEGETDK